MNSLVKHLISSLVEENTPPSQTILFPGAFKPPTKGHFDLVNSLASDPKIKELIVIISSSLRGSIGVEESKKIWDIYSKYLPSNVIILASQDSSPVKAAYDIIKNNPDTNYLMAVGYRDENDEKDLERIKSVKKYPNADSVIYKASISSRATNARKELLLGNQKGFNEYLPTQLSQSDKDQIWKILTSKTMQESDRKGIKAYSREIITTNESESNKTLFSLEGGWLLKDGLLSLTNFMIENGVNIKPLPKVVLIKDDKNNASNILGKTAYYDPQDKTIVLYTLNRHPIDILSSFCHELIHHIQNLEGRLNNINTQNILEDDSLKELEREAYEKGGLIFRQYKDFMRKSM